MTLLGACALLCFISAADFFSIEDFSSFKEPSILTEKIEALSKQPESEHLQIVFDYCFKNGKFPSKKRPENGSDAPVFASGFGTRNSVLLAREENMARDRIARKYNFSNVYALENSKDMARVAKFVAYSLACFPAGSLVYNSTGDTAMDRVYYMHRYPGRYGLMKLLPYEDRDRVTLKITFYEDYFMYNPIIPVPGHSNGVRHAKFVGDNFMMKKRLIAAYLNGMFNYTEDPRKSGCEWDAQDGMLINGTVLTRMAGSHLVGYAFNGFNDGGGTVIVDKAPHVVLRSQFVAVHAYIYWESSITFGPNTDGEIDDSYKALKMKDSCNQTACTFYIATYSKETEFRHYEYPDFHAKGGLKNSECDADFKQLCRIYYKEAPDYYENYDDLEWGNGGKCGYWCGIVLAAFLLLIAAAVAYFYFSHQEDQIPATFRDPRRHLQLFTDGIRGIFTRAAPA